MTAGGGIRDLRHVEGEGGAFIDLLNQLSFNSPVAPWTSCRGESFPGRSGLAMDDDGVARRAVLSLSSSSSLSLLIVIVFVVVFDFKTDNRSDVKPLNSKPEQHKPTPTPL